MYEQNYKACCVSAFCMCFKNREESAVAELPSVYES